MFAFYKFIKDLAWNKKIKKWAPEKSLFERQLCHWQHKINNFVCYAILNFQININKNLILIWNALTTILFIVNVSSACGLEGGELQLALSTSPGS